MRRFYLPYESLWPISPCHIMSGLFVSQPPFPFQVWPDLECNQNSPDSFGEITPQLTRSCSLLLFLGRFSLLAPSLLLGTCFLSLWSSPFLSILPLQYPNSHQGTALAHLDSLSPHDLVIWTDGFVPSPFGKDGSDVLANSSLFGTEATLSFSPGPVCSSFSAQACAILHALCWSWQHQQVCHFTSLLLSDSRSVLATLSLSFCFYLKLSGRNSLLFSPVLSGYSGSRTLVSSGELCG